jgi:hypothetical protein
MVIRITSVPEKYTIIYKTKNSYSLNALQRLKSIESRRNTQIINNKNKTTAPAQISVYASSDTELQI